MAGDKVCVVCRELFTPRQSNVITCSKECSTKQRNTRNLKHYYATANQNFEDVPWRISKIMGMAKSRAAKQDLEFDLDTEYLIDLYEEQGGKCAISGREFDLKRSAGGPAHDAPSLDKIYPELGYIKGNVRFTTYHVNVCLLNYGEEALIKLCKDILWSYDE